MAGKAGRSGRKKGALSWHQHATARCGHHLNVLIEVWLALAPERRFTVPPKIKRSLAEHAIRQTLCNEIELEQDPEVLTIDDVDKVLRLIQDNDPELRRTSGVVAIDVEDVLAWSRRQVRDERSLRRKVRRVRDDEDDDIFNPATGNLHFTLDSANPNVCWAVTDEKIVASVVTTFPN